MTVNPFMANGMLEIPDGYQDSLLSDAPLPPQPPPEPPQSPQAAQLPRAGLVHRVLGRIGQIAGNVVSGAQSLAVAPDDPRLTAGQNAAAARAARIRAGLGMLSSIGDPNVTPWAAFGQSALAGQQAGQAAQEETYRQNALAEYKQRLQQAVGSGEVDLPALRRLLVQTLIAGDPGKAAGAIAEVISTMAAAQGKGAPDNVAGREEYLGPDGKRYWAWQDKSGGWHQTNIRVPPKEFAPPSTVNVGLANDRENRLQAGAFYSRNKTLVDRGRLVGQAIQTLHQAQTLPPDQAPALYSSVITNFIQAADQKANIRWQLLNFFKSNADPSLRGKAEVWADRAMKGQYPPRVLRAMAEHLERVLEPQVRNAYEAQRKREIARNSGLDAWVDPWDVMMGNAGSPAGSGAQYGPLQF